MSLQVNHLIGFGAGGSLQEFAEGNFGEAQVNDQRWGKAISDFVGFSWSTDGGEIVSVTWDVNTVNVSTNWHVEVWADGGSSPSVQVGSDSDTINISSAGDITFAWSSGAPILSASTRYWIVFVDEGTGDLRISQAANSGGTFEWGSAASITTITDGNNVPSGYDGRVKIVVKR